MRILVTGLSGFVGSHLGELLGAKGLDPLPLEHQGRRVDITDFREVENAVAEIKPDQVYHLAAAASAGRALKDPEPVFKVNVEGTRNLLEAIRRHAPAARVLMVSTAAVYGPAHDNQEPIKEDARLNPRNPYAESKARAEEVCGEYRERYGLDLRIVRPQGHTGPRQRLGFVTPDLACQAAQIKLGKHEPIIKAGNLEVKREFSHVKDVVRAYLLIMEKGARGEIYNLASNEPHSIREVAETLIELAGIQARIESEPARQRKADESSPLLDTRKISALGFSFKIPFRQTMKDVLDYWLEKEKSGP